jgi:hypothetical protein
MIERRADNFGRRAQRALTNLAAWHIATVFVVVGAILLYLSEGAFDAVVHDLGALLIATGALSVLWDLLGRRALTDEVLVAADLSGDVRAANLRKVAGRYLAVPWEDYLARATEVDLFFAYASTWRATHDAALRALVGRKGARVRIVLPDLADEPLVMGLAAKFRYTPAQVRDRIAQAEEELSAIGAQASAGSTLQIRRAREFPVYTYYRFGDVAVTVLYAQAAGRTDVPTLVYERGGSLYDFFTEQFDRLWKDASIRPA